VVHKLPPSVAPPSMVLPLEVTDRVYGAFLLWAAGADSSDGDEVRVNLKIAVDIIARKIDLDRRRLAGTLARGRRQWRRSLIEAVDFSKDLKENFAAVARLIGGRLKTEFISLAVAQEDGTVRRLTLGVGRALLDEIGLDLRVDGTHVNHVLSTGKPMLVNRLAEECNCPVEDLVIAGPIGSLMAAPVTCRRRPCAVLTVASGDNNAYEAADRRLLESAGPILRGVILDDTRRGAAREWERRITLINDLMAQAGETADLQSLFQRVTDVLAVELRCTVVRVSTCSHDDAFMKSRAVTHDPSVKPATPGDGHLVMSLMPLHRRVRDSGRVLITNQEDDHQRITPPEAGQAFSAEVQSAVLVPVMLEQRVLAVIGVADARPWAQHRYRRLDVLFIRLLAAMLALAIRNGLGRRTVGAISDSDRAASPTPEPSQLRGRIKSSLSGIMGSVEMIKSRGRADDPALEKYLSIIDKSAKRINDCFAEHTQL